VALDRFTWAAPLRLGSQSTVRSPPTYQTRKLATAGTSFRGHMPLVEREDEAERSAALAKEVGN
jgi:hypothetical protein